MSANVGSSWCGQKRDKINVGFAKGLLHKNFQWFRSLSGRRQKRPFWARLFWMAIIIL